MLESLGSLPSTYATNLSEKIMSIGKKKKKGPMIEFKPQHKMYGGKAEDMKKAMMKMHGGKIHDAKYYQTGAKVAGCGPAQNNPRMTKAK